MTRTILYIHGLSSSGASQTAQTIKRGMEGCRLISPDLPICPHEALEMLKNICNEEHPFIIVGSSMGGMFAQQLHGYRKILVNPAFHVSTLMRENIGIQPFLNPRKNGEQNYEITTELCDSYEKLEEKQFKNITPYDIEHTFGVFGLEDKVVNCLEEYLHYYKEYICFNGSHQLSNDEVQHFIFPKLTQLFTASY